MYLLPIGHEQPELRDCLQAGGQSAGQDLPPGRETQCAQS